MAETKRKLGRLFTMTDKGDLGLSVPHITLWQGDCLEEMKRIPDNSVDMVLTDPP